MSNGSSDLPAEYERISYIESSRTQYIRTNILPRQGLAVEFESYDVNQNFINHYVSSGNASVQYTLGGNGQTWAKLFISGGASVTYQNTPNRTWVHWKITSDLKVFRDDILQCSCVYASDNIQVPITLFARPEASNYAAIRMTYFKIFNNDVLTAHLIPCCRKSDDEIGMYDIVNDVFYTNQGTGKFISGGEYKEWTHTPHYIQKTSTDTITTLPAVIYANDNNAIVGLEGNMSQTGTPSLTTPIQPSECGERTGNLLNPSDILFNTMFNQQESPPAFVDSNTYNCSNFISVTSGMYLRILNNVAIGNYFFEFDANKQFLRAKSPGEGMPMPISNDASYIVFNFEKTYDINKYMFARTSTPLPYEPYGQYKIPISSANTITNVYLGEVETTRRIKKLVFDGTENWTFEAAVTNRTVCDLSLNDGNSNIIGYCTHIDWKSSYEEQDYNRIVYQGHRFFVSLENSVLSEQTVRAFKSYLAAQYAAGTPVCVWYVLATEETAVVNEPIRKIGDYADTVSGITIPTIAEADTFDVDTTLKPSVVQLEYKGWHPVTSAYERENGAWT